MVAGLCVSCQQPQLLCVHKHDSFVPSKVTVTQKSSPASGSYNISALPLLVIPEPREGGGGVDVSLRAEYSIN